MGSVWELEAVSFSPYYRSYLGNGYVGVQVSPDGTGACADPPVRSFISGLYAGENEHLVEIPSWSGIAFAADTEGKDRLDFRESRRITGFSQVLDMREACLRTRYTWASRSGAVDFDIVAFVSRADPHLAVLRYAFVPHYDGTILLDNALLTASGDLQVRVKGADAGVIWLETLASPSMEKLAQAALMVQSPRASSRSEDDLQSAQGITKVLRVPVSNGKRYAFIKYVSFFTSQESQDPLRSAREKLREAERKGCDRLAREHAAAWAGLWESDIVVDDEKLQRRIHACLYHLLSSVREGSDNSIAPMGLSGDNWRGHIFWDAEFFMLPALTLLHPPLARSIVAYRYRTLEGAYWNARGSGAQGAVFGWQTGSSGRETGGGGFSKEIHNVGDVAFGQWEYYQATRDREYLERCAFPIIMETARYWAGRVTYNQNADRYEISGVIPPDESTCEVRGMPTVNNSVFTNAIARWNLSKAVEASEMLGKDHPADWKRIAEKMYLPFDAEKRIYLEYDGYYGHPIKQPDAAHLLFPLEIPMDAESAVRNYQYYRDRADWTLGHSFFPAVHPIIACRLGLREEAYARFREWDGFFLPPFEVVRECIANESTVFLTAVGGFLQNFLYGFGGIRIQEHGLAARPVLPQELPRITFTRLFFAAKAYRLVVEKKENGDTCELTRL